ncbi:hypothetical protein AXF42_Ash007301 [Apostasia shenzhenica]|uniref:Uncharacterized protein n=1 Tax=Apostasia shenzhenica TaxID=1088818 RepID=A0A2I0B9T4_9ASPA|nr:hypothetical protein AXF42_Ash007301 [Apostasia shenzhenica]
MASGIAITFRPAVIRASNEGYSGERKRRSGVGGGGAWWSPLFGWGAEPDYIDSGSVGTPETATDLATEEGRRGSARRFTAFTEKKARELRMRMMETESYHDAMYHSAIASRLASDVRRRSESDRWDL